MLNPAELRKPAEEEAIKVEAVTETVLDESPEVDIEEPQKEQETPKAENYPPVDSKVPKRTTRKAPARGKPKAKK